MTATASSNGRSLVGRFLREEAAFLVALLTFVILHFGLHDTLNKAITPETAQPLIGVFFAVWLFAVVLWAAFNVVRHADVLAIKLGEPLGTLILTLAVVGIEVSLISAVMLTGAEAPTMARDTMTAVLMIVLGGLTGASLLIGGFFHGEQDYNLPGARAYLGVLVPLAVFALVLPDFTASTDSPSFTPVQAGFFAIITLVLYGIFLAIQTVRHKSYFEQPMQERAADHEAAPVHSHDHGPQHATSYHAVLLLLTLVTIVLLAELIAMIVDFGIVQAGAPVALGGVIIALVVLTPESMAALAAARANQLQRSVNLLLGSALSTIGLTLPAVVAVSLITGANLQLGLDMAPMVLLLLTLVVCLMTFGGTRTNVLQGAVHIVLFLAYLLLIFSP
ncbi:hypothetical protein LG277_02520 [Vreelandella aquamarina]|uniref:calcium:proton antiporter n=1 Tax=Vreelandella aquamarina TaxID=77097 RepID=UPI00118EB110|nr:hypothetical protein [Halomonas sp.]TVM04654.1 MAG: calcium:proton antiporter [Halomonas sp.]